MPLPALSSSILRCARYGWALPCTLAGLLFAVPMLLLGATWRRVDGVLEVGFASRLTGPGAAMARLPFTAITFGHVVLGQTHHELQRLRRHEHAHVRQYERWGVVFFLAYLLASLSALLRGHSPYWHNRFEIQARAQELPDHSQTKSACSPHGAGAGRYQ
jgi:hypothetical protein